MTTLDRVFMLNVDEKLSFETIARIFKTGYSRIPVYEVSPVSPSSVAEYGRSYNTAI